MKKNELEDGLESDLAKVDQNTHPHAHLIQEENPMEESIRKTARLAKINLVVTLLGLGGLGYLHVSDKASLEDSIAKTKATLKQEIAAEMKESTASSQQMLAIADKNGEIEVKLDSASSQISVLEAKVEQLQAEIDKNAGLGKKLAELQSSMKKTKAAPAKAAPAKATKGKPSKKPAKKGRK